ncbi:hypothetical protein B0T26DRAFT_800522 [Lasiosphaeria miniovina]|uniref:Uncharacterized protein n=1 Tax=Lasiosphaeria miniovina TaxID=1954250 RepID=A0AA40EB07_9PEZI|nr:uncharacterized protein B0T26DRAFT_800522 [Lasiosphaeria miniovina]KAK0728883.1 hypothetical protein B0T26DRAFT_800522 [Lasiosphaeria miniovina]
MAAATSISPLPAAAPASPEPAISSTLSTQPPTLSRSAADVFASAVTGDLKSTTKSNAPLDAPSLALLVTGTGIFGQKPSVQTVSAAIRPTYAHAQYGIDDSAGTTSSRVVVEIAHYTDAPLAQNAMRQHLNTFDADVSLIATKTDKPLGQVSLQTAGSVLWVRDALWVRVEAVSPFAPPVPPKVPGLAVLPASPGTPGTSATGGTRTPFPSPSGAKEGPAVPIIDKLLGLAGALDSHLAKFAVPPATQLKPNTAVKAASWKGKRGAEFSFQLVDAKGTHVIKSAEPVPGGGAQELVSPMRNGTAAGEYPFIACREGKGKVYLVVAKADTLAVGVAEVTVEVVAQ